VRDAALGEEGGELAVVAAEHGARGGGEVGGADERDGDGEEGLGGVGGGARHAGRAE
jgi:hypothetical protein